MAIVIATPRLNSRLNARTPGGYIVSLRCIKWVVQTLDGRLDLMVNSEGISATADVDASITCHEATLIAYLARFILYKAFESLFA